MTRALCADGGVDTLPTGWRHRAEYYTVHDEIWAAAGMPFEGFLCIGCLESRLGRTLTRADFDDAPVNDLRMSDMPRYAWTYRTPRLISRLRGEATQLVFEF
jgi:hypothetical protein